MRSCLIAVFENQLVWLSFLGIKSLEQQLHNLQTHLPSKKRIENSRTTLFLHNKQTVNCLLVGTPFQLKVWKDLGAIEDKTTVSYEFLAKTLNIPLAPRAIANAIGENPIS